MLGSVSFLLAEIIIHHFKTELALQQRCVHCLDVSVWLNEIDSHHQDTFLQVAFQALLS